MGDTLLITAGEREPRCEFLMRCKRLANGFDLGKRGQRFESKQVRSFGRRCDSKHINAFAMELHQFGAGAVVVAVILGAIVKCGAIGAEGCSDKDTANGIEGSGLARKSDGAEQSCVSASWIETNLRVAHARNLIAGGFDDAGAGLDVGAMHRNNLLGCVFEHMRGPQRAVDVCAEILELGGHAAVEYVNTLKNIRFT